MNVEEYRDYCLLKRGVTESFPFDSKTLVFKVGNKMFALAGVDNFKSVNLKCDPEKAIELRAAFPGITGGFHMNKTHWNTVNVNEDVTDKLVFELIDHSYELIVKSLPKKIREEIQNQ